MNDFNYLAGMICVFIVLFACVPNSGSVDQLSYFTIKQSPESGNCDPEILLINAVDGIPDIDVKKYMNGALNEIQNGEHNFTYSCLSLTKDLYEGECLYQAQFTTQEITLNFTARQSYELSCSNSRLNRTRIQPKK